MRPSRLALLSAAVSMLAVAVHAAALKPALAGLDFLIGSWTSGIGKVTETGGTWESSSVISAQANGAALLRQDHVALFDKTGRHIGDFDALMTIYTEAGALHADYVDGDRIIHYTSASLTPGKSVAFSTDTTASAPSFRLVYTLDGNTLVISFTMAPPGQTSFHPIATGTMLRSG